jgi:competence protein ComEA
LVLHTHVPPEAVIPIATRGVAAPTAAAPGVSVPGAASARAIVVHVAGAVNNPGVYQLSDGTRVIDAIDAAGGLQPDADSSRINLAARLADAMRVYVPAVGETSVPAVDDGGSGQPSGPLNLNQATAEQLDALPGVGRSTAAAIIAYRRDHGPFQSVDQLRQVHGIGASKFEQIRPLVTV